MTYSHISRQMVSNKKKMFSHSLSSIDLICSLFFGILYERILYITM
jgi:hypothetical protein